MGVLDAVSGFFTAGFPGNVRGLSPIEIQTARGVFESTIPYGVVGISRSVGANNRPYTTPSGPFYLLHMGPSQFSNPGTNMATLIHELVHVWQGHNHFFTWGYVANSLWHQARAEVTGGSAYSYTPGAPWGMYNVEQQAKIVEDWFVNGQQTTDQLFPYIRDRIRRPAVSWILEPF